MFSFLVFENKKVWYLKEEFLVPVNLLHRKKGPAVELKNGDKQWWNYGKLHRDNNLPAVEYSNGDKKWWINDEQYFLQENGTKEFINSYRTGSRELHRRDLPAVEYPNGDQEWWLWGKRHRLDGPAVIIGNKQFWFEEGEFIKWSAF